MARLRTRANTRKRVASVTINNLPPQPGSVAYGPATTPPASLSGYATPGGMVISSRGNENYSAQVYKDISAAGGHHLMYIDPIVWNANGRYHDVMFNASGLGAAVPKWPGPISANPTGDLADFRVGGVLQSKWEAVLELMVNENPHISGWFLDDVGSRAWFPNFEWSTWTNTDMQSYRDGAIAIVNTARTVANRYGLLVLVNGVWTAGTLAAAGGGYPVMGTHGNAQADGGVVEHHDTELAFWGPYMGEATTQWGEQSPVSNGKPFCFVINDTDAGTTSYVNDGRAAWVSTQTTPQYDGVAPYTGGTFHATGIPSKATLPVVNPMPVSAASNAVGAAGSGTSMSWTCPAPAGLVEGNLLVSFAYAATSSTVTVATPTGWTSVGVFGAANTGGWIRVAYKYVTAGEQAAPPANYTFSGTSGGSVAWYPAASIVQYSGVPAASPIDASANAQSATNTLTHAAASVTTTTATRVLYAFGAFNPEGVTLWPSDIALRTGALSGGNEGFYVFDEARPTAGATGTRTVTTNGVDRTASVTVAIKAI